MNTAMYSADFFCGKHENISLGLNVGKRQREGEDHTFPHFFSFSLLL